MITERIILSIVAILMLILTIKRGDKLSIIITTGLTIGVLSVWTGVQIIIGIGISIYMLSSLATVLYSIRNKKMNTLEKLIISLTGMWSLVADISVINHYPYAYTLKLSMIIPIVFYITMTIRGLYKRNEMGFLTILNLDFFIKMIQMWR